KQSGEGPALRLRRYVHYEPAAPVRAALAGTACSRVRKPAKTLNTVRRRTSCKTPLAVLPPEGGCPAVMPAPYQRADAKDDRRAMAGCRTSARGGHSGTRLRDRNRRCLALRGLDRRTRTRTTGCTRTSQAGAAKNRAR